MVRDNRARLWAVILAEGGEPTIAPTRAPLEADPGDLLQTALERSELVIPAHNTVVIGTRSDQLRLAAATAVFPGNVLLQPRRRGVGPLILWPVYWIHRFDPEAIVVVIPAGHHARENRMFMNHVVRVAQRVPQRPDWLLVVGTVPTDFRADHDWIMRAECLSDEIERMWRVTDLQKASSGKLNNGSSARNGLWNTGVVIGLARTFLEAARECLPSIHTPFFTASRLAGTWRESAALDIAYDAIEDVEFFPALKEAGFPRIAASCLQPHSASIPRHARPASRGQSLSVGAF